MEILHTVEQAAAILQLHPDTIRLWLRNGRLRGRKLGRVWRISGSELRHLSGLCDTSLSSDHASVPEDVSGPKAKEPNTQ